MDLRKSENFKKILEMLGFDGVVVIAAQLHSTKPEIMFGAGPDPARGVSEIRNGEDL